MAKLAAGSGVLSAAAPRTNLRRKGLRLSSLRGGHAREGGERTTLTNYLLAGSDAGGERAAVLYTLITTARLKGVDPEAWLAEFESRLV